MVTATQGQAACEDVSDTEGQPVELLSRPTGVDCAKATESADVLVPYRARACNGAFASAKTVGWTLITEDP